MSSSTSSSTSSSFLFSDVEISDGFFDAEVERWRFGLEGRSEGKETRNGVLGEERGRSDG